MNLLTSVCVHTESSGYSLPELLSAMGEDRVHHLPHLRQHQSDLVHQFLCQVGAAILARAGTVQVQQSPHWWAEGLLALSGGRESAWQLCTEDLTQPAFMQPPLSGQAATLRDQGESLAAIDTVVSSQNHPVKSLGGGAVDDWLFALITLQTSTGYSGSGLYGAARMNSGLGSRCCFSLEHP